MRVTIAGMEVDLTKEEILEFHEDHECIDECPICEREAYTFEDYKAQEADVRHSSEEILPFREVDRDGASILHGSAGPSRILKGGE